MKRIFMILMLFFFLVPVLNAHPPSDIQLKYDQNRGVLTVKMTHVSSNTPKHHIRKIQLFINEEEGENFYYVNQTSGEGVEEEIPLTVKPGDKVKIKATCNTAGYGESEMVIPEETKEETSTKE